MTQSVLFKIILKLFFCHENFSRFRPFVRSYHSGFRQLIHDPGSPVEADLEPSLQHTDGRLILLDDEPPRICEEFVRIAASPCRTC